MSSPAAPCCSVRTRTRTHAALPACVPARPRVCSGTLVRPPPLPLLLALGASDRTGVRVWGYYYPATYQAAGDSSPASHLALFSIFFYSAAGVPLRLAAAQHVPLLMLLLLLPLLLPLRCASLLGAWAAARQHANTFQPESPPASALACTLLVVGNRFAASIATWPTTSLYGARPQMPRALVYSTEVGVPYLPAD